MASRLEMLSNWASAGRLPSVTSAAETARIAILMKRNIIVALAAAAMGIVAATVLLRPSSAAPEARFATLAG
jgi:hypothetical protein